LKRHLFCEIKKTHFARLKTKFSATWKRHFCEIEKTLFARLKMTFFAGEKFTFCGI